MKGVVSAVQVCYNFINLIFQISEVIEEQSSSVGRARSMNFYERV
ncbi:hypothetical protein NBRC111894_597 [Sporolactobacillus inulinus]|uniref:Uncharacterized protein n=1 Tax=Sporolactobacillus inulinus TaxID=2078 RepID=A0A4Y1Z7N6_9BACL|nr:hypothetical protein NBRC111894_597 [Sporolactobacillus inulinus]